jgi:hypothetical protein
MSDVNGRRVCATLSADCSADERVGLCIATVGHHVRLSFRYPLAGRLSMTGTVDRLAVLDGPGMTRPVAIVLTDGGAHVVSLAAISSWDRL